MLSKLFGSNTRHKILKLFLLNPNEKFYVREVSRALGLQLNSVHRELNNLEDIGLLITFKEVVAEENESGEKVKKKKVNTQEKKYYQINKDFTFYDEIKSLIVKSQVLYEKGFTEKLKKIGDIKILILTGLFIGKIDSEIDLFIVGKFSAPRVEKIVKELEEELLKEVNYSIMTEDEFKYRREIADIFIYNIIDGEKIVIIDKDGILQ
ncbi:MAG: winged helix-turn-helix domain-containing protein [bacterium]